MMSVYISMNRELLLYMTKPEFDMLHTKPSCYYQSQNSYFTKLEFDTLHTKPSGYYPSGTNIS